MAAELFRFPNKKLRSIAIKRYMAAYGFDKAVCFSCGNASRELKEAGVKTLDISRHGDMQALRWFTIGEVKQIFPNGNFFCISDANGSMRSIRNDRKSKWSVFILAQKGKVLKYENLAFRFDFCFLHRYIHCKKILLGRRSLWQ